MRVRRTMLFLGMVAALVAAGTSSWATTPFEDIAGNQQADNIDAIYNAGITLGCDPTHYCPGATLTRQQMAAFLARTAGLSSGNTKNFPKVNGRGQAQSYCSVVAANPIAMNGAPCRAFSTMVDGATTQAGGSPSIDIGADGLPIMSYYDQTNVGLRVLHCSTPTCTSSVNTLIDNGGLNGQYTALTIGLDGLPVIAYFDGLTTDLNVARCSNALCTASVVTPTVDGGATNVGKEVSIAIGTDGFPVIAHYDDSTDDLRFTHCGDPGCASGNTSTTLDTTGNVGKATSIAIGTDGFPVISYTDVGNNDLKVLHCGNATCSSGNDVTVLDPNSVGNYTSLAVGTDGFPIVAYVDLSTFDLRVAHCTNIACTASTNTTINAEGSGGNSLSLTIGTDGLPAISYQGGAIDLLYAHCENIDCTSASVSTVDGGDDQVAYGTSIAVGVDGVPVIAYMDLTLEDLRFARPAVR